MGGKRTVFSTTDAATIENQYANKQKKKKVDPCLKPYVKLLIMDHRSKFLKLKAFRIIHKRKPL